MAHKTAAEIAIHKLIAEDSFEDTCNILVWSGYSDSYTDEVDSWPTTISGVSCGFEYKKAFESERGQLVILEDEGILRLSLTQDITLKDKVEARNKTFSVDGINEGITCLVVNLKELGTND
jgi:hypothetical protein